MQIPAGPFQPSAHFANWPALLLPIVVVNDLSPRRIQEQPVSVRTVLEIEHPIDWSRDRIERALNAFSVEPVVFNEPQHRALVRYGMIHEVSPRKR